MNAESDDERSALRVAAHPRTEDAERAAKEGQEGQDAVKGVEKIAADVLATTIFAVVAKAIESVVPTITKTVSDEVAKATKSDMEALKASIDKLNSRVTSIEGLRQTRKGADVEIGQTRERKSEADRDRLSRGILGLRS